jgi:hypothetical protein
MKPGLCLHLRPVYPMSRRPAGFAHDARAVCAWGRKAELEDFPYG